MYKQHKSSENSILAFIDIVSSGLVAKERIIVLNAIARNQPCTSRELAKLTGIERTSITRSLNGLVNNTELVKEAYTAPCKTTNRPVYYYALADYRVNINDIKSPDLFS